MKKGDNNQIPRLIRYGYLSNTVYFIPDELSLTIRVDPKKEKSPRKRKPTKSRLAQMQEDKENFIWLFQQNQSDLAGFTSKYDMATDFHHHLSKITESDMLRVTRSSLTFLKSPILALNALRLYFSDFFGKGS